jgi:hypothetical protein
MSFCTFVLLDEQTETGRYMHRLWQIYSVAAWCCMQIDRNVAHVSIDKDQIHIVHCVHRGRLSCCHHWHLCWANVQCAVWDTWRQYTDWATLDGVGFIASEENKAQRTWKT